MYNIMFVIVLGAQYEKTNCSVVATVTQSKTKSVLSTKRCPVKCFIRELKYSTEFLFDQCTIIDSLVDFYVG